MTDRVTCPSWTWSYAALALLISLLSSPPAQAQVAPKESGSRIIHRFPPLPDIAQRKAEIDAKRRRTGLLTKLLQPVKKEPFLVLDLDQVQRTNPTPETILTTPTAAVPDKAEEILVAPHESHLQKAPIVQVGHEEPTPSEPTRAADPTATAVATTAENPSEPAEPGLSTVEPPALPELPEIDLSAENAAPERPKKLKSNIPTLRREPSAEMPHSESEAKGETEQEEANRKARAALGHRPIPVPKDVSHEKRSVTVVSGTEPEVAPAEPKSLPRTLPQLNSPPIQMPELTPPKAGPASSVAEKSKAAEKTTSVPSAEPAPFDIGDPPVQVADPAGTTAPAVSAEPSATPVIPADTTDESVVSGDPPAAVENNAAPSAAPEHRAEPAATPVELALPKAAPVEPTLESPLPASQATPAPSSPAPAEAQKPKAHDEWQEARQELHRLAKPIPIDDPALELAAEELKQLTSQQTPLPAPPSRPQHEESALREELDQLAKTKAPPTAETKPAPSESLPPGLKFARDAIAKVSAQTLPKPVDPTPPAAKEEPTKPIQTTKLPAPKPTSLAPEPTPPAMLLPAVSFDASPAKTLPQAGSAPATPGHKETSPSQKTPNGPEAIPADEPTLKPIPPAAEKPSPGKTVASSTVKKPSTSSKTLTETRATSKPAPAADLPLELPLPDPGPAPRKSSSLAHKKSSEPPPGWRPAMPKRTGEIVPVSASAADDFAPPPTPSPTAKEVVPSDQPRILAPIQEETPDASSSSILNPSGNKQLKSIFSRSVANRAIETLGNSTARTARERALSTLYWMEQWYKAPGAVSAVKQVATSDERHLMREAAVDVLAAIPPTESVRNELLREIAATNSEPAVRQRARDVLANR